MRDIGGVVMPRKHITITDELQELLNKAKRITGCTEASIIKAALLVYLKGLK